ncbi:MAG: hypothetical protein AB1666_13395 [Pseudomonadota bacterium]
MASTVSGFVKQHVFCRCDRAVSAMAGVSLIVRPEGLDSEREINEWWLVSGELAARLRSAGLPVVQLEELSFWGRFATGDALAEDPDLLGALPS